MGGNNKCLHREWGCSRGTGGCGGAAGKPAQRRGGEDLITAAGPREALARLLPVAFPCLPAAPVSCAHTALPVGLPSSKKQFVRVQKSRLGDTVKEAAVRSPPGPRRGKTAGGGMGCVLEAEEGPGSMTLIHWPVTLTV